MKIILFCLLLCPFAYALDEVIEKKVFELPSYTTTSGTDIPVKIGYETYGKLNEDKSNVILITHFFSGTSHAAGKNALGEVGYWDAIIGPGKAVDTSKYFVISSDTLVNVNVYDKSTVTTGPATINPKTKKPYGLTFPVVTIRDFVQVQRKLLDSLGIKKIHAVMGASGGSIQAVDWSVAYPDDVEKVIAVIGPGFSTPPFGIALVNMWVAPIRLDPLWKNGNYDPKNQPRKGMIESLKLIILSSMQFDWAKSIGGGFAKGEKPNTKFSDRFHIEAVFEQIAENRIRHMDANSLIYTAKAMQTYDVEDQIKNTKAEYLFIPVASDIIFPPFLFQESAKKVGDRAEVFVLDTKGGHYDGITQIHLAAGPIKKFLD